MYKTVKHSGCGRAGGGASGGSGEVRGSIGKRKKKKFVLDSCFFGFVPLYKAVLIGRWVLVRRVLGFVSC